MIGKDRALSVLRAAVRASPAGHTGMTFLARDAAVTHLAVNEICANTVGSELLVLVQVVAGGCAGRAVAGDFTPASLREATEQAFGLARAAAAAEAPRATAVAPASYPAYRAFSEVTARQEPRERADDLATIAARAARRGLVAGGAYAVSATEMAVINSLGVAGYHAFTRAAVRAVVSRKASADDRFPASGFAAAYGQDTRDIDVTVLAEEAMSRCLAAAGFREDGDPWRPLPPGRYDVVLEPTAVRSLLEPIARLSFGARAFDEGQSYLCGRLGYPVASPLVTLVDDPEDLCGQPQPFDFEGVPKRRFTLIEGGVARGIAFDTRHARRVGATSTGHAGPGARSDPMPWHLSLLPAPPATPLPAPPAAVEVGTSPPAFLRPATAALVAGVRRGLLVTRFDHTRVLDPHAVVLTGVTRDGLFLIEDGQLAGSVPNLRFTQSVWEALANVAAVGSTVELILGTEAALQEGLTSHASYGCSIVPPILVKDFNFTG